MCYVKTVVVFEGESASTFTRFRTVGDEGVIYIGRWKGKRDRDGVGGDRAAGVVYCCWCPISIKFLAHSVQEACECQSAMIVFSTGCQIPYVTLFLKSRLV